MSSSTWTPAALSDAHALAGICWRLVEAQHYVSTMKLVDTNAEQQLLEDLIETTKPPIPPECRDLDYLLSTPFRYGAIHDGSRFRRAGMTEGVFYAAETPETAVAEIAFHRLLFWAESPNTPWPANPAEYTAFSAEYATKKAIDLTKDKYAADRSKLMHTIDYNYCQAFADAARAAKIEIIRFASARDPRNGINLALLTSAVPSRSLSRLISKPGIFASARPGFRRSARRRDRVLHSTAIVSRQTPALRTFAGFAPNLIW